MAGNNIPINSFIGSNSGRAYLTGFAASCIVIMQSIHVWSVVVSHALARLCFDVSTWFSDPRFFNKLDTVMRPNSSIDVHSFMDSNRFDNERTWRPRPRPRGRQKPKLVMAKFSMTHHKQYLEKKNSQLRKSHGCFGPLAMEFAENAFPEAISGRKKWWKHVQAGLG